MAIYRTLIAAAIADDGAAGTRIVPAAIRRHFGGVREGTPERGQAQGGTGGMFHPLPGWKDLSALHGA